jgi:excisionase family DNA binding protein
VRTIPVPIDTNAVTVSTEMIAMLATEVVKSITRPSIRAPLERLAVSPEEAASSLGVSRDFFDEHIAPELRIVRRGRRKLIALSELERWLSDSASLVLGRDNARG